MSYACHHGPAHDHTSARILFTVRDNDPQTLDARSAARRKLVQAENKRELERDVEALKSKVEDAEGLDMREVIQDNVVVGKVRHVTRHGGGQVADRSRMSHPQKWSSTKKHFLVTHSRDFKRRTAFGAYPLSHPPAASNGEVLHMVVQLSHL